jgi:hypothetical protein
MDRLKQWWNNDLPKGVKFVFLVLLANAVPAIIILMSIPDRTETFFVWTLNPEINARLMGVMYANALILIAIGLFQPNWPRVRIIMVVITLFSILATVVTFFFLKPFLAHPWFHLTYWLGMYLVLFFAAPYVFITEEKKSGGRLPVETPTNSPTRTLALLFAIICLVTAFGLYFRIDMVNQFWPWTMPPLVGALIGVLFTTHAAAYVWALWDGDWIRIRPIFWQTPITGLLFILLPLLHRDDLRPAASDVQTLYYTAMLFVVLASLGIIWSYRGFDGQELIDTDE